MDTTGKDCRVQIPTQAHEFMLAQNALRRTQNVRLMSITLIVEAILEAGLKSGGWEAIALEKASALKLIGRRNRQTAKKK